ncbi:MAG: T9SS type A sorting domain-containing protein [Dysgonamonadaceae bacterium]|jgi:hypothetical protein|nr:T9SS type A sorting domain-containing protein [Dysgonamonadaceae bacterium]
MNKLIFFFVICIVAIQSIKAQCHEMMYDIYTPNGSLVITFLNCEYSFQDRVRIDSTYAHNFPEAIQIPTYNGLSSSDKFNCHGYAWIKVEQYIDRWIEMDCTLGMTEHPEIAYMTDGSYTEVSQETYPGKVYWLDGDHSAITTSQPGIVISKWGNGPLMQHALNYGQFGGAIKYYVKTSSISVSVSVSGPSSFCSIGSSATYSVPNLPAGATVTWSNSSNLSKSGNTGSSQVFTSNGVGSAWIDATVTINGNNTTARKNVSLYGFKGIYSQSGETGNLSSSNGLLNSSQVTVNMNPLPSGNYVWSLESFSDPVLTWNQNSGGTLTFTPGTGSNYSFYVSTENSPCPLEESVYFNKASGCIGCEGCLMSYNSNTNILEISFNSLNTQARNVKESYTVQLSDISGNLVKTGKSSGETVSWNLSSLRKGIYIVSVRGQNKQIYSKTFIK